MGARPPSRSRTDPDATVATSPRSWRAHDALAAALVAEGHLPEAEAEYREVMRINPRVSDAPRTLAGLLVRRGELDAAVRVLEPAAAAHRDGATWLALAQAQLLRGADAEALVALARTEELSGNVPSVRIGRAAIALRRGDPADALHVLDGLLAARPDRADDVLPIWIPALIESGREAQAKDAVCAWQPLTEVARLDRARWLGRLALGDAADARDAAASGVTTPCASTPRIDPNARPAS